MKKRALKVGEPIGALDPNEELVSVNVRTADYFALLLKAEQHTLDTIRSDIIEANDTIVKLSNQVSMDEHRVRLGEQRVAVWEFAVLKAKSLGELTKKV